MENLATGMLYSSLVSDACTIFTIDKVHVTIIFQFSMIIKVTIYRLSLYIVEWWLGICNIYQESTVYQTYGTFVQHFKVGFNLIFCIAIQGKWKNSRVDDSIAIGMVYIAYLTHPGESESFIESYTFNLSLIIFSLCCKKRRAIHDIVHNKIIGTINSPGGPCNCSS